MFLLFFNLIAFLNSVISLLVILNLHDLILGGWDFVELCFENVL